MKFKESNYFNYFFSLLKGTALAQIITFAISPILTRMYTPEEFGIYGVYIAICSLLLVFTTGRYEFALMSTKQPLDTINLLKVIVFLAATFSTFVLILLLATIVFNNEFELIWTAVPFTILLLGINQGLNYTHNKFKNFETISYSKIIYSFGNGIISIVMGLFNFGIVGLISANILALFLSVLNQFKTLGKEVKSFSNHMSHNNNSAINLLKKYVHYPIYNMPSAFFEMLAMHAPTFIIMYFYTEVIVGYFNLTLRVINVPIIVLITSLSQVLLSKISDLYLNNQSGISNILFKISTLLFAVGLVPTLLLMIYGKEIFMFIFGDEWAYSGLMASVLSLSFLAKFVVSPLSVIFVASERVKQLSIIQIMRSIFLCILLIACAPHLSPVKLIMVFAVFEVIFHLIYFVTIMKLSRKLEKIFLET